MDFIRRNEQIASSENNLGGGPTFVKPLAKKADTTASQGLVRLRSALGDVGNHLVSSSAALGPASKNSKMAQATNDISMKSFQTNAEQPRSFTLSSNNGINSIQEKLPNSGILQPSRLTVTLPHSAFQGGAASQAQQDAVIRQVTVKEETIAVHSTTTFALPRGESVINLNAVPVQQNETFFNKEITQVTRSFSRQRLTAVSDIDEKDEKVSDVLCSEYINDIMEYLHKREKAFLVPKKFLDERKLINSRMRGVLLDWLVDVHFQYNFCPETLYMCQKMLDKYLMIDLKVTRSELQLIGVTCLYLAAKFEEVFTPAIRDFATLCDNTYTVEQIRVMEQKVLNTLAFDILAPLPCMFLRRFSKAAKSDMKLHSTAKYIMELAMVDYDSVDLPASAVAAGALAVSLMILRRAQLADVWNPTLEHYSTYSVEALRPIALRLANLLARMHEDPKLKAVKTKYGKQKSCMKVAKSIELSVFSWKDFVLRDLDPESIPSFGTLSSRLQV